MFMWVPRRKLPRHKGCLPMQDPVPRRISLPRKSNSGVDFLSDSYQVKVLQKALLSYQAINALLEKLKITKLLVY